MPILTYRCDGLLNMSRLTNTSTRLSDLGPGDVFLFICRIKSVDATTGIGLALFGPSRVKAADAVIHTDGSMTGQLTATPDRIPVNIVTGLTPINIGDVLVNDKTGETLVCRWSAVNPDGSVVWSASPAKTSSIYQASGWTIVGQVQLN